MAESQKHIELVQIMHDYCIYQLRIDAGYVLLDAPNSASWNKPPQIGEYRPDIYVNSKDLFLIGDAKTSDDWNRMHSVRQYQAFFEECQRHNCDTQLLLAVPWMVERSVRNRLNRMLINQSEIKTRIIVISDMWRISNATH